MRSKLPFILMMIPSMLFAQARIPAAMVSVVGPMTSLPTGTVQQALSFIDTNLLWAAAVEPVFSTNATPYAFTPSFPGAQIILYRSGGTNVQVWQSTGVITQSWTMMYPVSAIISTNILTNGILPRCVGDELILNGASNLIYRSFNGTSWLRNTNAIYSAP